MVDDPAIDPLALPSYTFKREASALGDSASSCVPGGRKDLCALYIEVFEDVRYDSIHGSSCDPRARTGLCQPVAKLGRTVVFGDVETVALTGEIVATPDSECNGRDCPQ